MSLRINHNVEAQTAHRNLIANDKQLGRSLEKLSSGLKVNSAADGPATLVISENMRAQIGGLTQAIDNNEAAVSLVQTAEGAMTEVNRLLIDIRQRAIHAANEGINDAAQLEADQSEIENALAAVDRIASNTQFGKKRLLDGSRATNGSAQDAFVTESGGRVLEFVSASAATKGSEGVDVVVNQNAEQAATTGTLTEAQVKGGVTLALRADGKVVTHTTSEQDSVKSAIEALAGASERAGLNITIDHNINIEDTEGTFEVRHKEFGSDHDIQVRSSVSGIFQKEDGSATSANEEVKFTGKDVQGTLNGEAATGQGQFLTGKRGNRATDGLVVKVNEAVPEKTLVGQVRVEQNALTFQVGANEGQTVSVALLDTSTTQIAREVQNDSGFTSLADIDVRTDQGAQDTIRLVDRAIEEISANRGALGAFQRNTLESNLSSLRIASENLTAAESTLRDADMAQELTNFTRNQILTQSATAQLAQANAIPQNVLSLLASQ